MSRSRTRPQSARNAVDISHSYHELRDQSVAERIVNHTGIAPPETVYEIGAGAGLLTAVLARRVQRVVAIEIDRSRWQVLKQRFHSEPTVAPVLGDALRFRFPRSGGYVVAGNMPFGITSPLIRRLLSLANPPTTTHLVVQREAALKWTASSRSTVAAVLAQVGFSFEITLALHRNEFVPRPRVDCVLLCIRRRARPLLSARDMAQFTHFVERGFGRGRGSARQNLGKAVGYRTLIRSARELGFDHNAAPGELSAGQWLGLFIATR